MPTKRGIEAGDGGVRKRMSNCGTADTGGAPDGVGAASDDDDGGGLRDASPVQFLRLPFIAAVALKLEPVASEVWSVASAAAGLPICCLEDLMGFIATLLTAALGAPLKGIRHSLLHGTFVSVEDLTLAVVFLLAQRHQQFLLAQQQQQQQQQHQHACGDDEEYDEAADHEDGGFGSSSSSSSSDEDEDDGGVCGNKEDDDGNYGVCGNSVHQGDGGGSCVQDFRAAAQRAASDLRLTIMPPDGVYFNRDLLAAALRKYMYLVLPLVALLCNDAVAFGGALTLPGYKVSKVLAALPFFRLALQANPRMVDQVDAAQAFLISKTAADAAAACAYSAICVFR